MKERRKATGIAGLILLAAAVALPINAYAAELLVPMGCAVGIELEAGGVIVAGFSEVQTDGGGKSPAESAGMKIGDVIMEVDGRATGSAAELLSALKQMDGAAVSVRIQRDGRELMLHLQPVKSTEGRWQLGLWLRDGVSGIGTVTYYDPESGAFGALGHGINDTESGQLLPFDEGSITEAAVVDVVKGAPGAPGELCGQPDRADVIGGLVRNTDCGVFGTADFGAVGAPVPVAEEEEVKLGPATILATVDGKRIEEFTVEISRIYRQPQEHRFLMLTVTDPRLLAQTGGIVQGMSGSPILQDGKLIGAVTHVLLSDAKRGYGISIREMLDAAA